MYHFRFLSFAELAEIKYKGSFPSSEFNWIKNWFDVFEKVENNTIGFQKTTHIVGAYKEDNLVAIIPLVKLSRIYFYHIKVDFLEFLSQQWSNLGADITQFQNLETCFTDELVSWLRKRIKYHFLFFKYLPETSVLANKYKLFHYSGAPFVNLQDYSGYEEFALKVYSRKFRKDLRRILRKAETDGYIETVEIEKITNNSLEKIKRISKSKESDGKSFMYSNQEKQQFHLKMYEMFPSQVTFLKLNNKTVAYVTSIDWNGERIGIDAAFDREYRKYKVGLHCFDFVIQKSFADQKKKFSFGLGLDTYKFHFTDQIQNYFMCFDFRYNLKSLLLLPYFIYRLKKEEEAVKQQLPKAGINE